MLPDSNGLTLSSGKVSFLRPQAPEPLRGPGASHSGGVNPSPRAMISVLRGPSGPLRCHIAGTNEENEARHVPCLGLQVWMRACRRVLRRKNKADVGKIQQNRFDHKTYNKWLFSRKDMGIYHLRRQESFHAWSPPGLRELSLQGSQHSPQQSRAARHRTPEICGWHPLCPSYSLSYGFLHRQLHPSPASFWRLKSQAVPSRARLRFHYLPDTGWHRALHSAPRSGKSF